MELCKGVDSLWVRKRGTLRIVPRGATQHKHQLITTTLSSYWSGVTTFRSSGRSIVAYGQADCNGGKSGGRRLASWRAGGAGPRRVRASLWVIFLLTDLPDPVLVCAGVAPSVTLSQRRP